MKTRRSNALRAVLASVLICVGAIAQNSLSAGDQSETDTPQSNHLEQDLERLNSVITGAPSGDHHERAEVLFRLGRFEESVLDYDAAARFGRPHDEDSCWERGLAQYYAGDFREGAEQFARYHRVGALDIENGLWRFLCIAEENGIAKARETMFEYPRKVREPFPALLNLYLGQGSAEAVLEEAENGTDTGQERTAKLFNAHYYLGKYYEIVDENALALTHVQEALKHRIPHFMYACAEADAERLKENQKP